MHTCELSNLEGCYAVTYCSHKLPPSTFSFGVEAFKAEAVGYIQPLTGSGDPPYLLPLTPIPPLLLSSHPRCTE